MLEVRDITKIYNAGAETEMKLFDHFSLTVEKGQFVSIVGGNGSGKTSLLNIICGSIPIEGGDVLVGGKSIAKRRDYQRYATMGRVYQDPALGTCPSLTVLENLIEAPIAHKQVTRKEAIARAYELLDVVGLRNKADAWSRHLSGGQQQRIAIARALALDPRVILFDEPTSALDPELVGEVLDVIKKLARSGTTLVVVTHEVGFAREVADQVVFMVDGRIVEQGSSDEVLNHPQHPRTRQFLSRVLPS